MLGKINILLTVLLVAALITPEVSMSREADSITVEWYGHSCFLLTLHNGAKILTDPYDTTRIPYKLLTGSVDIIFSTHDHFDHNAVSAAPARYILRASGREPYFYGSKLSKKFDQEMTPSIDLHGKLLTCTTIPTFHDDRQGGQRGANGIIRFTVDGIVFVHLGDLGDTLNADQIQKLKPVDVLMIPVGGYFTVEPPLAQKIVAALAPKIVFPMHYKTDILAENFPIVGVDAFLSGYQRINRHTTSSMTLQKSALPDSLTIEVLKYHDQP